MKQSRIISKQLGERESREKGVYGKGLNICFHIFMKLSPTLTD